MFVNKYSRVYQSSQRRPKPRIDERWLLWWKSFNKPSIKTLVYRDSVGLFHSILRASEDDTIWTVWRRIVELPAVCWQIVWTPDKRTDISTAPPGERENIDDIIYWFCFADRRLLLPRFVPPVM